MLLACSFFLYILQPGAKARSVAMSLGNQEATRSILASSIFLREDLVIIIFLRSFFFFRRFKESSCRLMAKECALSTGNLLWEASQGTV